MPDNYGPSKREEIMASIRARIPKGWTVRWCSVGRGFYRAESVGYQEDGIAIEGPTEDALVSRVRTYLERVEGRGVLPPPLPRPAAPVGVSAPVEVPTPTRPTRTHPFSDEEVERARKAKLLEEARTRGYEGDFCDMCGAATLRRVGSCLRCDSCGATGGCG
jgi:hypothetical protein